MEEIGCEAGVDDAVFRFDLVIAFSVLADGEVKGFCLRDNGGVLAEFCVAAVDIAMLASRRYFCTSVPQVPCGRHWPPPFDRLLRYPDSFFLRYIISYAGKQASGDRSDIVNGDLSITDGNHPGDVIDLPADAGYGFIKPAGAVGEAVPVRAGREILHADQRPVPADFPAVPGQAPMWST